MRLFNRVILCTVGLCLLAAGTAGLLVEFGATSGDTINSYVPFQTAWTWQSEIEWGTAELVALSACTGTLALIAAWLAVAEVNVRRARPHGRAVIASSPAGRTRIGLAALARAIARDIDGIRGVSGARVERIDPGSVPPSIRMVLEADAGTDLERSGADVLERAHRGLTNALGGEVAHVAAVVRLRPVGRGHERRVE